MTRSPFGYEGSGSFTPPAGSGQASMALPAEALLRGKTLVGDFELTLCTDGRFTHDDATPLARIGLNEGRKPMGRLVAAPPVDG